jgi:glycosyltransferase involved in cell wall biosynthesis
MRTLPQLLRNRPEAHVVIVGGDEVSYGRPASGSPNWREKMLADVGGELDLGRVHFVGKIPYPSYVDLLNVSRAHAYWTTPFVLSWSFLEAAINGVPLVASATPPVMEFAPRFDLTVRNFFSHTDFTDELTSKLAQPRKSSSLKRPAELNVHACVARQSDLLRSL